MNDADSFDNFTKQARVVMSLAQEEARRFQHDSIGTYHLLLGLAREGHGVATNVLAILGIDLNKARSAIEFLVGRGDHPVAGSIGLTLRAKMVIKQASEEAARLNHHAIGTGHLLLGLVHEGDGIVAGILESLGIKQAQVHKLTLQMLNQTRQEAP